jgi:integrase
MPPRKNLNLLGALVPDLPSLRSQHSFCTAFAVQEDKMQRGSLIRRNHKQGPDVWQFRWSEKSLLGRRVYRKRVIGTVEQYPSEDAARSAVVGLVAEINSGDRRMYSNSMTVSQLSDHFEQRELGRDDTWRSYATKKSYHTYLKRWIVPHWGEYGLFQIRTVEVESWLRRLPLARSSCAKLRNLMSVLFNHARRYELFDRNPIRFVRQSAKRRTAPTLIAPIEIKMLVEGLGLRERTLVLLAASTGLRQSELFGLKWGDFDFLTLIHSASGEEPGNRKAHRMAHFSPDLRNTSEERRHRIQGDARADAA